MSPEERAEKLIAVHEIPGGECLKTVADAIRARSGA